ncbi:ABC transporter permease [Paenarthrobacter sp. NPDC089316]|uniref:ABC transporter permease n=1 Tax=unclassified Paenarthrobacter TaxID=2634190 RepID=UPI003428EF47
MSSESRLPVTRRPVPQLIRRLAERRIVGWILVVVLLLMWQFSATLAPRPGLPPLTAIFSEWLAQMQGRELIPALLDTVVTTLLGFSLATVIGVVFGFMMGRIRIVLALLEPAVELIRQTPVTALFPLLILFLGIGQQLEVTTIALSATFPILMNSYAGARSVSRTMRLTSKTYKLGWWQTQVEVAIPAALPFILVGMRQALGVSLVLAVVAGMLAGNSGIGYFILQAQQMLDVTALFAGIFSIALVGYLLNQLFLLADARLIRWRRHTTDS